jgi:hypothetical protein
MYVAAAISIPQQCCIEEEPSRGKPVCHHVLAQPAFLSKKTDGEQKSSGFDVLLREAEGSEVRNSII